MYHIGEFLMCNRSRHPVVVVYIDTSLATGPDSIVYIVSTREYNGDYARVSYNNNTRPAIMNVYQKLYEIGKFGSWWYAQHKDIYQQLVIEALN